MKFLITLAMLLTTVLAAPNTVTTTMVTSNPENTPSEALANINAVDTVFVITVPADNECPGLCVCTFTDGGLTIAQPNMCPCQRKTYCSIAGPLLGGWWAVSASCCTIVLNPDGSDKEEPCVSAVFYRDDIINPDGPHGCCVIDPNPDTYSDCEEVTPTSCSVKYVVITTPMNCCSANSCVGGLGSCYGADAVDCSAMPCCSDGKILPKGSQGQTGTTSTKGSPAADVFVFEAECGESGMAWDITLDCEDGDVGGPGYHAASGPNKEQPHAKIIIHNPACSNCEAAGE